jgi:hypothetical protein
MVPISFRASRFYTEVVRRRSRFGLQDISGFQRATLSVLIRSRGARGEGRKIEVGCWERLRILDLPRGGLRITPFNKSRESCQVTTQLAGEPSPMQLSAARGAILPFLDYGERSQIPRSVRTRSLNCPIANDPQNRPGHRNRAAQASKAPQAGSCQLTTRLGCSFSEKTISAPRGPVRRLGQTEPSCLGVLKPRSTEVITWARSTG